MLIGFLFVYSGAGLFGQSFFPQLRRISLFIMNYGGPWLLKCLFLVPMRGLCYLDTAQREGFARLFEGGGAAGLQQRDDKMFCSCKFKQIIFLPT